MENFGATEIKRESSPGSVTPTESSTSAERDSSLESVTSEASSIKPDLEGGKDPRMERESSLDSIRSYRYDSDEYIDDWM